MGHKNDSGDLAGNNADSNCSGNNLKNFLILKE